MRYEYVHASRQWGKSRYLAERVAEAQDAGADLCTVIVPESSHVNVWFDLLFDVGIDPSRIMLLTPATALEKSRGVHFTLVGIDNADQVKDLCKVLDDVWPSAMLHTDLVTVTYTDKIPEECLS